MGPQTYGVHGVVTVAGQVVFAPVHVARAVSTSPAQLAGRHTCAAGARASAGHQTEAPVQLSGTSQSPAAGRHSVTWDGRNAAGNRVAPGVYFCSVSADGATSARKLVLSD